MARRLTVLLVLASALALVGCGSGGKMMQKDQQITDLQAELAKVKAQQADAAKRAGQADADLKKALADLEAAQKLSVDGNRIVMQNAVLFESGSVKIKPEGQKVLDDLGKALAQYSGREILIEGHTDNVPIAQKFQGKYKSNWELSTARALAVLHYTSGKWKTKPSLMGAVGYGEYRPVADNATEAGRAKNRRVVIVVGPKV